MELQQSPTLWCIDAGPAGEAENLFLEQGRLALAWGKVGNLREQADVELLVAKVAECYPGKLPGVNRTVAEALLDFAVHAQVGDWVIYPSIHDRQLHLGQIDGEYTYEPSAGKYAHQRPVKWVRDISREELKPDVLSELESARSFFPVREYQEQFVPQKPEAAPGTGVWFAVAILLAAAILPYANSLWGSFHAADQTRIVDNEHIRSVGGLISARPAAGWLTSATEFVNYKLHGLGWMPGWHATNILLHAAAVLALFWVLRLLLPRPGPVLESVPFWAAALLAIHPLASEPVNYIHAREVILAALFALLALGGAAILHRATTPRRRLAGGALLLVSVVLAALSKEGGAVAAAALPLLYVLLFVAPAATSKGGSWLAIGVAVAGLAVVGALWAHSAGVVGQQSDPRLGSYASGQATTFWRYMHLAIRPQPSLLSVDHAVPIAVSGQANSRAVRQYGASDGDVLAAVAGLAALVIVPIILALRRGHYAALWLLMLPLGMLPYFLKPSDTMMAEPRFYLPLVAFCALAGLLLAKLAAVARPWGMVIVLCLCAAGAGATVWRNAAWRSDLSLWADAAAKAPGDARAISGLAAALLDTPGVNRRDPDLKEALHAIGQHLAGQSIPKPIKDNLDAAEAGRGSREQVALLLAAISVDPALIDQPPVNPSLWSTVASAHFANGDVRGAIQIQGQAIVTLAVNHTPVPRELFRAFAKYLDALAAKGDIASATTFERMLISALRDQGQPVPAELQVQFERLQASDPAMRP